MQQEQQRAAGQGNTGVRNYQQVIIGFLVGVIVGGGSAWLWFTFVAETPETTISRGDRQAKIADSTQKGEFPVSRLENQVMVTDQFPGMTIEVDKVIISQPGWVVIHESLNGKIGNALGAGWFDRGEQTGFVELLRGTIAGGTYYAVLYNDAKNDHLFKLGEDMPFIDEQGQQIKTAFIATPPPPAAGE